MTAVIGNEKKLCVVGGLPAGLWAGAFISRCLGAEAYLPILLCGSLLPEESMNASHDFSWYSPQLHMKGWVCFITSVFQVKQ